MASSSTSARPSAAGASPPKASSASPSSAPCPSTSTASPSRPTASRSASPRKSPTKLKDAKEWDISSFTYQSKWTYGSDPEDKKEHKASIAASDAKSVTLKFDGLAKHRVYRIAIPKRDSPDGSPLQNNLAFYTVNAVPKK